MDPISTVGTVPLPPAAAPSLPPPGTNAAGVKNAAQNFEAFFVSNALEGMFAGVQTDPIFGGGSGEKTFRSLLFSEYGKEIAKGHSLGIADAVQREMIRLQEEADAKAAGAAAPAAGPSSTTASATAAGPAPTTVPSAKG